MKVAIVMPAHNEVAGLPLFLAEIAGAFAGAAHEVSVVVVDDASTDGTAAAARAASSRELPVRAIEQTVNAGHGPTALRAYREGIASGAEAILHVDGDGQFHGADFPRLLDLLEGADVVHGVRRGRSDAWYRRVLTGALALAVRPLAGGRVYDVNTPFRAYRAATIAELLRGVPTDSLVPHVHLSVLERRSGLRLAHLDVESLPRRGGDAAGTMWGRAASIRVLPPKRLLSFVRQAVVEVWRYRVHHREPDSVTATHGA